MGQIFADRHCRFSNFQDGGRPPSLIRFEPVWTTQEECLVAFVTVQNLIGISAVVLTICKL